MLPGNPNILLSVVNTKLRDRYADLDALCDDLDEDREEIIRTLGEAGYVYSPEGNQFIVARPDGAR